MIYENVKRLCTARGTTICQVEKACGIGNGVIGKWRNMGSSPSATNLLKLAQYFGVTVDELLAAEPEEEQEEGT